LIQFLKFISSKKIKIKENRKKRDEIKIPNCFQNANEVIYVKFYSKHFFLNWNIVEGKYFLFFKNLNNFITKCLKK